MRKSREKNRGSLTVETLLFLIPFMLAFCTIINAARFIEAEMIIHHAITQSAKEISAYSYVLTKTKITDRMQKTNKKSKEFQGKVNETVGSVEQFVDSFGSGDASSVRTSGQTAWNNVKTIANDPSSVASGVLSWVKNGVEQKAFTGMAGSLAKGSIQKQLTIMSGDADQYLERLGVVGGMDGLDFSQSKWNSNTSGKGNVDIVVTFTMKNTLFPMFDIGEHEYIMRASTLSW